MSFNFVSSLFLIHFLFLLPQKFFVLPLKKKNIMKKAKKKKTLVEMGFEPTTPSV